MLVMWVLLDSYKTLFSPLEVFYGIRFGSKDHIMVQLSKVHWIGIIDPFLYLRGPSWGSQKGSFLEQMKSFWDPPKSQKSFFMDHKCILSVVTT